MVHLGPPLDSPIPVVGGGRWGRIICDKIRSIGLTPFSVTSFPLGPSDVKRSDLLPPLRYDVGFVVSQSNDHYCDYQLLRSVTRCVFIEKNLGYINQGYKCEALYFNQFLYNEFSLDMFTGVSSISIESVIEKNYSSSTDLFDWICHDLGFITSLLVRVGMHSRLYTLRFKKIDSGVLLICKFSNLKILIKLMPGCKRRKIITSYDKSGKLVGRREISEIIKNPDDPLFLSLSFVFKANFSYLRDLSLLYSYLITDVQRLFYSSGSMPEFVLENTI